MQNEPASDARSGLLLDGVRHRAGLIVVCVLLGLAAGFGAHLLSSSSYESTSTVFLSPLEGNAYAPGCTDELTCLETEASIATSDAVIRRVQNKLKLDQGLPQIRSHLQVVVPTNQLMVQATATFPSAEQARQASAALASEYLEFRSARAEFIKTQRVAALTKQVSTVRATQTRVLSQLANADPTTVDFLRSYALELRGQLLSLGSRLQDAQAITTFPGRISNSPLLASPGGLPLSLLLPAGGLLGLLAGLALAAGRERSQDLVRHASDVELAGLPVLATLTHTRSGRSSVGEDEAYRQLRAAMLSTLQAPGSCVVAGVAAATPAVQVGAELALSLWRAGEKVAYVDVDTAGAVPAPFPSSPAGPGLAEAVRGDRDPAELLHPVEPGLWYLPHGGDSDEAREFLVPSRLRSALVGLTRVADYVILGAQSISSAAGQTAVASSPLTVFVVPLHSATRHELVEARRLIERSRTTTLGVVLTDSPGRRGRTGSTVRS